MSCCKRSIGIVPKPRDAIINGGPTWFGSKAELLDLVQSAHALGLQVYADLVFNHNSGGDAQEMSPILAEFSFWPLFCRYGPAAVQMRP